MELWKSVVWVNSYYTLEICNTKYVEIFDKIRSKHKAKSYREAEQGEGAPKRNVGALQSAR